MIGPGFGTEIGVQMLARALPGLVALAAAFIALGFVLGALLA